MKSLVIGSNSFSGSYYVDYLLNKKHNVIGVSRSKEVKNVYLKYKNNRYIRNFKYYKIDLNKNLIKLFNIIKKFRPDYIINFSSQGMVAESWRNPQDWYNTNTLSTIKLHDFLRKQKFLKRYIHFGTPEVYGSTKINHRESEKFNPSTPYAISRAAADLSLISFGKFYKFPFIITRASNVYGPGQQLYRIIPIVILNTLENKKIKLHGGGFSKRSFIHMDDVSSATYKIMLHGKLYNTYHISTKKIISIKDLTNKIILKLRGSRKLIKNTKDRLGKDKIYFMNSNKLRKLNWRDKISLDKGIDETIAWVKKNYSLLKKEKRIYVHKK